MKIVLADDEAFVRYGLKAMLLQRYPDAEIREAGDGEKLLEAVSSFKPDFVFADIKMPKMSGLEALEVWAGKSDAQWIILSGYSDFEYARKCIQYNVVDYLLKPVRFDELEKAIERGQEHRNQKYIEKIQKIRNEFLYFFDNREKMDSFSLGEKQKWGMVLFIDTCLYPKGKKINGELIESRLNEACRSVIGKSVLPFWIKRKEEYFLICSMSEDMMRIQNRMFFHMAKLREECRDCRLTMYFTDFCDTEDKLFCQLTQIENLRYFRIIYHDRKNISVGKLKEQLIQNKAEILTLLEKIDIFVTAFKSKDYMQGVQAIHGIENMFPKIKINQEEWAQLAAYLDIVFENEVWRKENLIENFNQILTEMKPIHENVKGAESILQIKNFIDENYHEPITVQWLAKKFHITPNYLSALFKRETSMNIVKYVNHLRMKEAEYLLRTTNLSVKVISERVGFGSTRYFTKLFIECYGCYPSDIRRK